MSKPETHKTGTWIVKQVPQDLMRRARIAALAQNKTVRSLLMDLVEAHLSELERKGLLAKGKWRYAVYATEGSGEMTRAPRAVEEPMKSVLCEPSSLTTSQLFLPFTEPQPSRDGSNPATLTPEQGSVKRGEQLSGGGGPGTSASRLSIIRDYLERNFPTFVLQQRYFQSGSVQITLYRVPDGTIYRMTVDGGYLVGDGDAQEIERFLEAHGIGEKLPMSGLSPILLDRDGLHLPASPVSEEAPCEVRAKLGRMLLGWFIEATGLSFAFTKGRSPL
jgi:hypothetical protein